MKNHELIAKLKKLPQNLPIMFKVAQEITGCDDYTWMCGECTGVKVEDIYDISDEIIGDFDYMFDRVNDDPCNYGLPQEATFEQVTEYIEKNKKQTVVAIYVSP